MLHGFAQTNRCWGPLLHALGSDHEIGAIDLPGHGGSGSIVADLATTASLVSEVRATEAITTATVTTNVLLGYSLGARVALIAGAQRQHFDALVLISGSPGLRSPEERAVRRRSDEALAERIESIGTEAFIDEWLAGPLFEHLDADAQHRSERLRNQPAGLASSLRLAGTGTMDPLWDQLGAVDVPVLVIAGADDAKFASIASEMDALLPHATLAVIGGAGHTVHLEQPSATIACIRGFLATIP